jgi:MFS family permease
VFAIGTFGCAAAHSVHYLWVFRIMQGASRPGPGVVVGRAIIRDLYSDAPAARLLSMVTMIFSIAPAIAPVLGGWIVTCSTGARSSWRCWCIQPVLLAGCAGSTCPRRCRKRSASPSIRASWRKSYWDIFSSPLFHMKSAWWRLNFGGLFLFIAGAPVLLPVHLHLGPSDFAWLFVPAVSRHLPRRAGRQPPGRQDDVRAPDRHRLRLHARRRHLQRRLPPVPAAGAALDGAADVLLSPSAARSSRPARPCCARPVPAHPRHGRVLPVLSSPR